MTQATMVWVEVTNARPTGAWVAPQAQSPYGAQGGRCTLGVTTLAARAASPPAGQDSSGLAPIPAPWPPVPPPAPPCRVPLTLFRVERELADIALLLSATGGNLTSGLRRHFEDHWGPSAPPEGTCEFCKLQGRILAAEGRKRLSYSEERKRVIPPGASRGAALTREAAAVKRDEERRANLPRLGGGAEGRKRGATPPNDSDLW